MRILLIEDDIDLCQTIYLQLLNQGYYVDRYHNGEDALHYALKSDYDLIILDRMLPIIDGLSITQVLRNKQINTPIIMVTAMSEINNRIEGLDAGADDYLIKPFAMEELFARIRALVRRPANIENIEILTFSNITVDTTNKLLVCNDKKLSLSKREIELLAFLIKNKNIPVSRDRILAHVWGADTTVEMGNLDNYIHFLRRRLKNVGSDAIIKTIYGVGYQIKESESC
ncbi:response regulator transcription factor [Solibacillus sp. CAU 1738]|uniref:response regulator transcription factor n=1 Tax=Solibacillus sp. CAU 1738 TaxID=3140363 RepID=UPI00325FF720